LTHKPKFAQFRGFQFKKSAWELKYLSEICEVGKDKHRWNDAIKIDVKGSGCVDINRMYLSRQGAVNAL
jgi:hypothetical protein